MRRQVEPADIQCGDTVRVVRRRDAGARWSAHEYVANHDGDQGGYPTSRFVSYIVGRRGGSSELPTVPTLGVLRTNGRGDRLAIWMPVADGASFAGECPSARERDVITGFDRMTAVPSTALHRLRATGDVATFLADVAAIGVTQ